MNNKYQADIYRDLNNIKRYLNEHKGYTLINEEVVPEKYKVATEEDVDDFENKLQGKAILKINKDKAHSFDGISVAFRGILVYNNLEYNFLFNLTESTPLISMSNGQNVIPLTNELLQVFGLTVQYFTEWKGKWSSIVNDKN